MAHTKIISPSGWDFDRHAVVEIPYSSRGLIGNDRADFLKYASHDFVDFLDEVRPQKDEHPIHILSHGATEFYGPNRNGDGFKEATCRKYHKTFEKLARIYRNHKNKDPRISFGIIKKAAYNERMKRVELLGYLNKEKSAADRNGGFVADKEMEKLARGDDLATSMACPKVGTLVKLRRGWKKVEDVRAGDLVLTHRGRYRRVYARVRRTKQAYARVSTRYCGRQVLEFTPEHEFFVARWEDVPKASHRATAASPDFRRRHRDQLHAHARWVPCGDLKPGDLLLMPIDRGTGTSALPVEAARLLGYYTAEGSVTSDGYLCFTCHKDDAAVEEVPRLAGVNHGCIPHSASAEAVNLTVYSKPLAATVAECVGRGVRKKVIPREVVNATAAVKLEYAAAWFNGDGWQDEKGLHWSTCSRTLSIELQMLLAAAGIPASVYRIDHTSDLPDRPRAGDGIEYTVNVSNRYSAVFAGRSKAEPIDCGEHVTVFITGDYLAVPVKSVDLVEEEIDVCDLSVEDDESFTAYGFAVHNCRVPYDVCSWCQNKARTRDEYCKEASCAAGGCKDNLTRLVKMGRDLHHLHVDNPHPAWFDSSIVWKPADRIAYANTADYLTKAAADLFDGNYGAPGWKVAADLGVTPGYDVVAYQEAELAEFGPAVACQVKLAAALEGAARYGPLPAPEYRRAFGPSFRGRVAGGEFGEPGTGKFAAALGCLADDGAVLPVEDFAALTKRAGDAAAARSRLPGVYGRMLSDGTLSQKLAASPYRCDAAGPPDPAHRRAAAGVAKWASLDREAVSRRCVISSVRGEPVPPLETGFEGEKQAADGSAAEALARDYACYTLSALHRIAGAGGDFVLTAGLSVLQNHVK